MILEDPQGLDAWCRQEAAALRERLARLGAGIALLATAPTGILENPVRPETNANVDGDPDRSSGTIDPTVFKGRVNWSMLAGNERDRWRVFGDCFAEACVAALKHANVELSREGLAYVLADAVGLPHWQDDPQSGRHGFEALKAKISSEVGRLAKKDRVLVRAVPTGRRGETRLMWRLPETPPPTAGAAHPSATERGTGTWAGARGTRSA